MNPITDIYRGNCKCGKWLLIMPCHTEAKPLECHGMCHSDVPCGRKYIWGEKAVQIIEPESNGLSNKTQD